MSTEAVVQSIEKELQVKLTRNRRYKGYGTSGNGNLTTLFLQDCGIETLGVVVSLLAEAKHLTSLDLSDNEINDISALSGLRGLTSLNLSINQLTDISALSGLRGLTSLNLSKNLLTDISALSGLRGLTSLNLSKNLLTGIYALTDLKNLVTLDLWGNNLSDISVLRYLKRLTSLTLWSNNLADIFSLRYMDSLQHLDLWGNKLTDISALKELQELTWLDVGNNQLSDASFLNDFSNLTSLGLWGIGLTSFSFLRSLKGLVSLDLGKTGLLDLSFLRQFKRLTSLKLGNNELTDISVLGDFNGLRSLYLSDNQLTDISVLGDLKGLETLYLGNNQLTDISVLGDLKGLKSLDLRDNQLTDISALGGLKGLRSLDLSDNQLTDISALGGLKGLETLHLDNNQLSDISVLGDLKGLKSLDLRDNQLTDISALRNIRSLERLDLGINPIEVLPPWITEFDAGIGWGKRSDRGFAFYNNPLQTPPPEIVKGGKGAIRSYFEQLKEQREDYLFEAKMLILGEPGAGKTSLAWKIRDPSCELPKEDATTRGIDVKEYYFPIRREDFHSFKEVQKLEDRNFRVNIWDFGGQEIYKATHRFFLSKRSIYVLVADSRNEDTDFNYWLYIVEMFGGTSPLLIVLNEKYDRKRSIDTQAMKKRFTNIANVLEVNFAENDLSRLNALLRAIRYHVSQLPHIGSPIPAKWTAVRQAIENDSHNAITLQDYLRVCSENGITQTKDALVLSQYFHDIGVFLHFQDDDLLKKTIFLKPNWATNAAYMVLDHPLLGEKKGRFNKNDAQAIWNSEEYELFHDELLRLMQKFFLTYEVEDSGEYIVPERLEANQPEYGWEEKENLSIRYDYDLFMPKGIMSQLTVRMNRYIRNHDLVWRRGVVLEREGSIAEIIESYDSRFICIRTAGKNRRDFMTILTEALDGINAQYEKMKVTPAVNSRHETSPHAAARPMW